METIIKYQSFNQYKTIEEFKYNLILQRTNLRSAIKELEFYTFLINTPIYKSKTMNLFEKLESFKEEIKKLETKNKTLLNEVGMQLFQVGKKIDCNDLTCDQFFIDEIDQFEKNQHIFSYSLANLKSRMFEYLQHVII